MMLYPKIMIEILKITELEKQNESHSSFQGWQKKKWVEIFADPFLKREESDYMYFFLQMGGEQDVEGIKKVC